MEKLRKPMMEYRKNGTKNEEHEFVLVEINLKRSNFDGGINSQKRIDETTKKGPPISSSFRRSDADGLPSSPFQRNEILMPSVIAAYPRNC